MNIVKVNAIGDNCPIPVVKTKKALDALTEASVVEVSVDNEIAVHLKKSEKIIMSLLFKVEKSLRII